MYKPDRKLTQDTDCALAHECELLILTFSREIPYSMYSFLEERWIAVNWNRLGYGIFDHPLH